MGYSLQANSKTREGARHIDRNAQFEHINTQAKTFLTANEPVISVDTKKKELVGNFKNNGREWRPKDRPELVNVHDFIDPKLSRAVPYGVYDITKQCRLGQHRHGPRYCQLCGQCDPAMVAHDGKAPPSRGQTTDDQRGRGRQQWISRALMESRVAGAGRRDKASHNGLSPASRDEQVEQDRASSLLIHHDELEGQAVAQLSHDRSVDRRNDDRRWPQSAG